MGYYWTLCFVLLLILYTSSQKETPGYNGIILATFLLFVFYAFREGFTPDFYNYEDTFNFFHGQNRSDIDWADNADVEAGFRLLCIVMPSYRLMVVVYTLLYCICVYLAFKYYISPKYWWLTVIMLFCYSQFLNGNMSAMRSGIVTCLLFISLLIKFRYKIGWLFSIALMIMALTIHKSSIILFPLIFIPSKPLKNLTLYIVYAIAVVFIIISVLFAQEINKMAFLLSTSLFEDEYLNYFDSNVEQGFSIIVLVKILIKVLLLFYTLQVSRIETAPLKNTFIKLAAAFYLLYLLPSGVGVGMITRFYAYFVFPCLIGTSFTIEGLSKQKKAIYIACVLMCCLWQVYDFYLSPTYKIYGMKYDSILF